MARKKSVEELYKSIFSIKESLQDAIAVAQETATLAETFGGEISRVITSQINDYFIPTISKYIEDTGTPGAVAPLVTFLDSVPLAMTRQEPSPEVVAPSPVTPDAPQVIQAPPTLANPQQESKKALNDYRNYLKELDKEFKNGKSTFNEEMIDEEINGVVKEFSDEEVMELSEQWGISPEEVKAALYDQAINEEEV